MDFEAMSEAMRDLISIHRDEFEGIYMRRLREIEKYGAVSKWEI